MTRRWGLPIVLLLASAATPADAPKPLGKIERTAEFQGRVDAAIDRGVAWLKQAQAADGSFAEYQGFPGATTALAYHTMRVCGVAREDPSATRAWESLRRSYRKADLATYGATLFLTALTSHGDPVADAKNDRDVKLSEDDARWAAELANGLVAAQRNDGVWGYEVDPNGFLAQALGAIEGDRGRYYDHSNTQYALLGLKCAARCGVAVDPSVWQKSLAHFLSAQEKSGPSVKRRAFGGGRQDDKGATSAPVADHARGWGYVGPEVRKMEWHAYDSMTAGGVSTVVICRSELLGTPAMTTKLEAESEKSAWDGLAWLGTHWDPKAAVRGAMSAGMLGGLDLYEFYGVERAGVLAGVDWMGMLDWYGAGALPLLDAQSKAGSWAGKHMGLVIPDQIADEKSRVVVDSCFALLFLKRGTVPVRRGAVTQGFDINFAEAAKLNQKDFEDFVDVVLSWWRRESDAETKARIFDGATSVGGRIVEPLLVRMDSPDVDKRAAAHALLKRATGLDFGYVADASPEAREAAVEKWQAWWIGAKDKTSYDAATKRLVVK